MPRRSSAPKERFEAIEILLLWERRVSRSRLLSLFDVHGTLASRDIANYRLQYPDACEPEMASKSYVASWGLRPQLTAGEFDEYQRLIGASRGFEGVAASVPFEHSQVDATAIRYPKFSQIHQAISLGRCIQVQYRSMTNPQGQDRIIRPHALIQAGPRWHVRAFCGKAQEFRDFNLGRISTVSASERADLQVGEQDRAWHQMISIRLVPHRGLSAAQAMMVRDEYMGGTVAKVFTVRASMAKYLIQSFRAAVDPDREKAPEHLLMVANPEDLPAGSTW
jgi:predicted DNA-binding transcriptional regulator YafY